MNILPKNKYAGDIVIRFLFVFIITIVTFTSVLAQDINKYHGGIGRGAGVGVSAQAMSFPYVQVAVKVFLEGPYSTDNDNMSIALKTAGFIPVTSPYSEDPRTVNSVPEDVTDWVLVQLRSAKTDAAIASRSAFLNKSGSIVADDGTTAFIQLDAATGSYYIVIRHRNHLAIMSDETVVLASGSSTLYDFSTGTDKVEGADMVLLNSGVYGLYAGNANCSGGVNATDYLKMKTQVGNNGYYDGDVNLSGTVNATDYLVVKPSIGKNSNI
ncbi:hypothetical protein KAR48_15180 [bacterium]|nr:hypothetical protein [bacterium]